MWFGDIGVPSQPRGFTPVSSHRTETMNDDCVMNGNDDQAQVLQFMKTMELYADLMEAAQTEVNKSNFKLTDLQTSIELTFNNKGRNGALKNAIYKYVCLHAAKHSEVPVDHLKDPISYVFKAQQSWEKKIMKSLNSMCTELNVPLARQRTEKEQKEFNHMWTALGADGPDFSQIRPVYAPKDFLEVVTSLNNVNYRSTNHSGFNLWGIIQIPLKNRTMDELRIQFNEMSINQWQSGMDDEQDISVEIFDHDRIKLGQKVIASKHAPLACEFTKKGSSISLRGDLWCQMMGIKIDDVDILYYEKLKSNVLQHELLIDNLLYKDVKLTATNDDHYFVFEDFLYQILLPFSRDTVVLRNLLENSTATPARSYIRGKVGLEQFEVYYPPSGVIPFHGFAMYVSPLCYLYKEPIKLYYVFRELYTCYFFRLHVLSTDPQGILSLSQLFETLLQTHEAELFYHLKSVNCQPLKIAFKWLMRAFSGFLASDQVLILWDRILAFNSLEILSVLAVAIFTFRKTNLMKVQTYSAAEGVLADLTTLQVLPLIQLSLFCK
ncbi:TBC1 domain family member 19 isoform X2 [Patella vulgata]|uniref:TBC1 domain family member 19 isoform X2 n=1 Tax=Patella vulgata TaxID=6465 RepID=UPI00217FDE69|nr:TBC1 domain family member 19 isoform X2 [Patella vulgata]